MSDNRAFHYALGASLALHALALFTMPQLADTARRAASIPPQIIARLMEPAAPAPEPPIAEPVPPVEPPRIKPAPPKKTAKPKAERQLALEKPAPVAPPPDPAPVLEQAQAVPAPPPLAAVEPRAPAAAPAPAPAQAAPQPAPEFLSRDQYRVQLIDEARRHKRYPPLARENNWQGDVRVGVFIGANGRPTVSLKGSSGYDVLDRQALEMFTQAARAVPLPPGLRGKEFSLEVRAIYGLED